MSNQANEVRDATHVLRDSITVAKHTIISAAYIVMGNIRWAGLSRAQLRGLKKELRDYNAHTDTWKDRT